MPSPGLAGTSPASPEHLDRPLFKSHKSLPRKSELAPNNDQGIHISTDQNVHPSKGAALATAPALPLTPPGVSQDETPTASDSDIPRGASSPRSVNGIMTPSKPSHPPTPETTPPRLTPHRPGLNPAGQTPSSSRAESFQTAYEMISDAETETPRRSSQSLQRPAKQRTPAKNGSLESPTDAPSSGRKGHKTERSGRPRRSKKQPSSPHPVNDAGANTHDSLEVPRTRVNGLRERVHDDSPEPGANPSMENFRDQIGWPPGERPADPVDADDTRRHSGVSTSSTIEAMIIDSPRPTKRTLRHSEKRVSLRSASSPVTRSERSSLASNPDSHHRLVHKIARITENDRKSIASDISASGSSTLGAPQQNYEVVPVVVIPDRRSSLKSSASTSRNPSKSSSSRRSRAPPTLSSRPGSIDAPRSRKRTMSDSSATTRPSVGSRGRSLSRPVIPPRSSSLSAPTSQNNSRSTSLTSESLRNHTLAMDLETQNKPSEPPVSVPRKQARDSGGAPEVSNKTHSILIGVEDMSHLRPPSAPFTAISIPSSSPGPVEINEATTVVFFPHNNESLLLVNPQLQSGRHGRLPRIAYRSSLGTPRTPEMPMPDKSDAGEMSSPLKNPRRPPKPPIHNSSNPSVPADVVDPQVGEPLRTQDTHDNPQPPRRGSRRSWRVRPGSESFNSFTRSLSLKSAKNRKSGKEIDDKLQPFWRPRRFWEDSSETEGDSPRDETPQAARSETDQVIKNSLGMPQPRVAFEGPQIARRSSPDMRRRFDGTTARRSALVGSGVFTPEALYSQTSLHQRHFRSLSWWRLRFRFGSARDFRRRLRRQLQRRAEGKREARRERLKQSIGEAVFVDSSTQTRSMIQ
ncbi:hypothetical protein P170DRAFT_449268 [Aspergillus steynii IBT 23096]|uniref:Uncharacterized protein n=1 Tax=Aspergillus steynii IBT 23096 TaxID=1392250 RepID=A0A2I2FY98_9EURO|nr:uncharacterized protein P170DRAFT_449268 [Aspergillus steynii IBT 23096]PLB45607.1 hypothetical protein P170DRAFT_449268 [Aspergillus steynii IBT 23096]